MAKRLRLCIVNPFQHGGGAEYQIKCLLDVLGPSQRYEIFYLARHIDSTIRPEHYSVVKIGSGQEMPKLGYAMDAVPLYRALSHINPDVIYQRVACGYTGICGYYAHRHGTRFVWHVAHETDVTPGKTLYGRNPLRRLLDKRSVEYGMRQATHIVTQTSDQAQLLMANYGLKASAVIPNFHPQPSETIDKSGPLRVVWIANLKPWKRPDAFVRLANQLRDLEGVRFLMVGAMHGGSGSAKVEHSQGDLVQAIRNTPNLEYLGELKQADVNALLARAHLFVNTSVQEGFPNTFIQAWMRGVPVVSLSVDPDQVLEREQVGALASSEARMAEVVRSFLTNQQEREACAQRAVHYALTRHSMRNAVQLATLLSGDELLSPDESVYSSSDHPGGIQSADQGATQ